MVRVFDEVTAGVMLVIASKHLILEGDTSEAIAIYPVWNFGNCFELII